MKVYLFGAGASNSYSHSITKVKPPLAKDFFKAYQQLKISEDRHVLIGFIVNYVRNTRGIDPFDFASWNENIENFLTEIDELINTKEKFLKLPFEDRILFTDAYKQMLFLFTSVLNEIQNGTPCNLYASLIEHINKEDILLTFNWDCLLDRALFETGKWSPHDGYGIEFSSFFRNGWKCYPANNTSSNLLLKLHGSTNWLVPYFTYHFQTGEIFFSNQLIKPETCPIFCFVHSEDVYETYENRTRKGYAPFSYYYYPPNLPIDSKVTVGGITRVSMVSAFDLPEFGKTTIGGYPYASMPFIVPPIKNKNYNLLSNVFDKIWDLSLKALIECNELIIIGYSFPNTDIRSWDLLYNACLKRDKPMRIVLVNPFPQEIETNIKNKLFEKCTIETIPLTFSEYIKLQK
jgi:hypothetical protein